MIWYKFVYPDRTGRPRELRRSVVTLGGRNTAMAIGARLKELRLRKGKSLQQVADAVAASKAHIWDLERGGSKNPSMELLKKLADYFEVSVSRLTEEEAPNDEAEELMVLYRDLKELDEKDREIVKNLMRHFKEQKERR